MKLYTEEQVVNALNKVFIESITFEDVNEVMNSITPIELPSDEEIDAHVEDDFLNATEVHKYSEEAQLLMKAMCKAGALWMRDKIGGDK